MRTNPKAFKPYDSFSLLNPGVRFMMLGAVLFSIGAASIKMAGSFVPASEILFARAVVGICFCMWMLRSSGAAHLGKQRFLLFLRGIFGACAFFTMIYAYIHLPLADATVIIFFHPVVVAIMASIVLKEKLPLPAWGCILVSLAGVALVTRPGFLFANAHSLDRMGVIMAFAAVFFSSSAILAVRKLAKTEHPNTIMLYPLLIIIVAAPVAGGADWVLPNFMELCLLVLVGCFMNAGQYYMTKGYSLGTAATISAVGYLEIVFAALWGVVFFSEVPDLPTIAGSILIIGSTYVLGRVRQKA